MADVVRMETLTELNEFNPERAQWWKDFNTSFVDSTDNGVSYIPDPIADGLSSFFVPTAAWHAVWGIFGEIKQAKIEEAEDKRGLPRSRDSFLDKFDHERAEENGLSPLVRVPVEVWAALAHCGSKDLVDASVRKALRSAIRFSAKDDQALVIEDKADAVLYEAVTKPVSRFLKYQDIAAKRWKEANPDLTGPEIKDVAPEILGVFGDYSATADWDSLPVWAKVKLCVGVLSELLRQRRQKCKTVAVVGPDRKPILDASGEPMKYWITDTPAMRALLRRAKMKTSPADKLLAYQHVKALKHAQTWIALYSSWLGAALSVHSIADEVSRAEEMGLIKPFELEVLELCAEDDELDAEFDAL